MSMVRSCYSDTAYDDHGPYRGDVDGLIAFLDRELTQFERTMHLLGNHSVVFGDGDARAETYCVAWHRHISPRSGVARDMVQGIRYCDVLQKHKGEWRIHERRIVLDWMRVDEVANAGSPPADWVRGMRNSGDLSYRYI